MKLNLNNRQYRQKTLYAVVVVFVILYLLYSFIRSLTSSLFFTQKDRLNIVLYDKNPLVFSFDLIGEQDYVIPFMSDVKVEVPGGYGLYRVGGVGKLAQLEKDPEILKKTFTLASSTFVDFYFYKKTNDIFYGYNEITKKEIVLETPQIIFMKSNANLFDRLYITLLLTRKSVEDIKVIKYLSTREIDNDVVLVQSSFAKDSLGLFYQKKLRTDKKSVQLVYNQYYNSAQKLSYVLEGTGIRVNDITQKTESKPQKCVIREDSNEFSYTAQFLAKYFKCNLKKGPTDVYDILFELGKAEEEWEL